MVIAESRQYHFKSNQDGYKKIIRKKTLVGIWKIWDPVYICRYVFLKNHKTNESVGSFNINHLIKYMGRYNWSQGNSDIVLLQELEKLPKKSRHNNIIITTL